MRRALGIALVCAACRSDTPAPRELPSRLVVGYATGLDSADPIKAVDSLSGSILANVYEPLVDFDADLGLVPALAESWHMPDDLTWDFELRPGVRLHDGRRLTAEIVARSLERARSDPASRIRAELQPVEQIEAPDPITVRIRTRFAFAALPNRLASVPISDLSAPGETPAGTGPYRLRSWAPGKSVFLEAFGAHRGGPPGVRSLEFRVIEDPARRLEALARGEVHLITALDAEQAKRAAALPGVVTSSRHGLLVVFLAMDCARDRTPYVPAPRNPFRNPRVRRAVALSFDRKALVQGALAGEAEIATQVVGPKVFGFNAHLAPIPHDPAKAHALLAASGFGSGFDVTLDLSTPDSRAERGVAEALVRDLAAIRIRVVLRPQPISELLERVEARDTSFYLMPWISTSADFGITADYLLHTRTEGYGQENGSGYSSLELDRLLDAASRTVKPGERRALLEAAAEQVHKDLPVVPIYRDTDLYALRAGLVFKPRLDRQVRALEMRWAAP